MIAYSFSDGVRTTTGPSANAALYRVVFSTDAAGVPTFAVIAFERTPGPPYTTGDANDPNSLFSYVNIFWNRVVVVGNTVCNSRGVGSNPTPGPGACNVDGGGAQASSAQSSANTQVTVTRAVPTLSEWAMILLGLMLAGGAALILRHRRHLT